MRSFLTGEQQVDDFWIDEDETAAESAFFELIADFLDCGGSSSRPAVLLCQAGRFEPYDLPRLEELPEVAEAMIQEALANDRLLSHLLAKRPDIRVLDYSHTTLEDMAALVTRVPPTHVFCVPPAAWQLFRQCEGKRELAIPKTDVALLNELGMHAHAALGLCFGMVALGILTRSLDPGVRLGTVARQCRTDPSILPVYEDDALRALRRSVLCRSELLDVSILNLERIQASKLPKQIGEEVGGPTSLVSLLTGSGPGLARFRRLAGPAGLQDQCEEIRACGGFVLDSSDPTEATRPNAWITIGDADQEEWWEPERHSAAFRALRSSFRGQGDWIEFGSLVRSLRDCWDSCYESNTPAGRPSFPVMDEAQVDQIQAGRWDGSFGERVSLSSDPESDWSTSDLIQVGDLIVHAWANVGPPRNWVVIAREEHAGSVPSETVRAFRLRPRFEYARQWLGDFLRSEAFLVWQALAEPTKMFSAEHLERLPVPLPSRARAAAFSESSSLGEKLRDAAEDLRAERTSLLRVTSGEPGWSEFGRMVGRTRALSRAVRDLGQLEAMVRHTYPRPLALAWRDGESASEPGEQLKIWLRLAEACAAYAAAMRLSELDAQGQLVGSNAFRLFGASLRKGGLTFGSWTSILKAKDNQQQSSSALGLDLATVEADTRFLAALDKARELRNAADHHRIEQAELKKAAERARSLVVAALTGIEPLVAAELVEVEYASNDPKGSRCLAYRARIWSGDAPLGEPEEASAEWRLESGALYLRCLDGTWIMPSPFLVVTPRKLGEICVPDHLDGNGDLQFRPLADSGEITNVVAAGHYHALLRSGAAGRPL